MTIREKIDEMKIHHEERKSAQRHHCADSIYYRLLRMARFLAILMGPSDMWLIQPRLLPAP